MPATYRRLGGKADIGNTEDDDCSKGWVGSGVGLKEKDVIQKNKFIN